MGGLVVGKGSATSAISTSIDSFGNEETQTGALAIAFAPLPV
jgi:hypothetical protein